MAVRRPLVQIDGKIKELSDADTIIGASGGGNYTTTISAKIVSNELIITHPLINSTYAIVDGEMVRTDYLPSLVDGELHLFI